jgi:hypothetical protein
MLLMDGESYVHPMEVNILLTDFVEKYVMNIASNVFLFELGHTSEEEPGFLIEGITERNNRVLVPLTVTHEEATLKTLFLCATSSTYTYLCERT